MPTDNIITIQTSVITIIVIVVIVPLCVSLSLSHSLALLPLSLNYFLSQPQLVKADGRPPRTQFCLSFFFLAAVAKYSSWEY